MQTRVLLTHFVLFIGLILQGAFAAPVHNIQQRAYFDGAADVHISGRSVAYVTSHLAPVAARSVTWPWEKLTPAQKAAKEAEERTRNIIKAQKQFAVDKSKEDEAARFAAGLNLHFKRRSPVARNNEVAVKWIQKQWNDRKDLQRFKEVLIDHDANGKLVNANFYNGKPFSSSSVGVIYNLDSIRSLV